MTAFILFKGVVVRLKSVQKDYLAAEEDGSIISTENPNHRKVLWEVYKVPGSFSKIRLKNLATSRWLTKSADSADTFTSQSLVEEYSIWIVRGKIANYQDVMLKSAKGEFLHRCDSIWCDITTWHTGLGNAWTVEVVRLY